MKCWRLKPPESARQCPRASETERRQFGISPAGVIEEAMADIQKHFEKYHRTIRMDYDYNSDLAEKRDRVLDRLTMYLKANDLPGFERLLQGSYKMKTGTKPIEELLYDIDVGACFKLNAAHYTADEVRGWVYEALKDHTDRIEKKGPCIRVVY